MTTNSTCCWETVNKKINKLSLPLGKQNVDIGFMHDEMPENRIREWRLKRKLTQDQLGEAVGCSGQQIELLENRKRRLTHRWMNRISSALECFPSELLHESEEDSKRQKLLNLFDQLDEKEQDIYLHMGEAFLREDKDADGRSKPDKKAKKK